MSEFITLKKSDSEFNLYLMGELPNGRVATPVKSFHVGTDQERVTFKIENEAPTPIIKKMVLIAKNTQWGFLVYLLAPLMLFLSLNSIGSFDVLTLVAVFISIVCCYFSLVQFNAYFDHVRGSDRLSSEVGVVSSPIQKSVVSAGFTYKVAWINLIVGGLLGLWLLHNDLSSFLFIGAFCLVVIFGYSHRFIDLKGKGLGEVFIFAGMGPVAFYGVSFALGLPWSSTTLLMSIIVGASAVTYLQARQLLHLMTDDKAQVKTLAVRWGFDGAIKGLQVIFNLSCILLLFLSVLVDGILSLGILPVFIWGYIKIKKNLSLISSPLHSHLRPLAGKLAVYHLFIYLAITTIGVIGRL